MYVVGFQPHHMCLDCMWGLPFHCGIEKKSAFQFIFPLNEHIIYCNFLLKGPVVKEAECVLGNLSFYQGNLISNGWQAKNKDINHSKDTKHKVVGMYCRFVFYCNVIEVYQ